MAQVCVSDSAIDTGVAHTTPDPSDRSRATPRPGLDGFAPSLGILRPERLGPVRNELAVVGVPGRRLFE
jgi:hypothetical protein